MCSTLIGPSDQRFHLSEAGDSIIVCCAHKPDNLQIVSPLVARSKAIASVYREYDLRLAARVGIKADSRKLTRCRFILKYNCTVRAWKACVSLLLVSASVLVNMDPSTSINGVSHGALLAALGRMDPLDRAALVLGAGLQPTSRQATQRHCDQAAGIGRNHLDDTPNSLWGFPMPAAAASSPSSQEPQPPILRDTNFPAFVSWTALVAEHGRRWGQLDFRHFMPWSVFCHWEGIRNEPLPGGRSGYMEALRLAQGLAFNGGAEGLGGNLRDFELVTPAAEAELVRDPRADAKAQLELGLMTPAIQALVKGAQTLSPPQPSTTRAKSQGMTASTEMPPPPPREGRRKRGRNVVQPTTYTEAEVETPTKTKKAASSGSPMTSSTTPGLGPCGQSRG